jgi:hypothetical protein
MTIRSFDHLTVQMMDILRTGPSYHSSATSSESPTRFLFLDASRIALGADLDRTCRGKTVQQTLIEVAQVATAAPLPFVKVVSRNHMPRIHDPIAEHHLLTDGEVVVFPIRLLNDHGNPGRDPKSAECQHPCDQESSD